MGPDDIFAVLFEYGPESVGKALFARQGMQQSLGTDDFRTMLLRRGLGGQSGTQWFFTEAGRPFTFYAVLGSHARRNILVPRVNALLAALSVSPQPLVGERRSRVVELIGPYLIGCTLLIVAGAMKAARPDDTARALAPLVPARLGALANVRSGCGRSSAALHSSRLGSGWWPSSCRGPCRLHWWPPPMSSSPGWWRMRDPGAAHSPVAGVSVLRILRRRSSTWQSTSCSPFAAVFVADVGADRGDDPLGARSPTTAWRRTADRGGRRGLVDVPDPFTARFAGRLPGGQSACRGDGDAPVTFSTTLVERTSSFLGTRLSRRGFINRSAFAGSAVAIGAGMDLALKPGTAYGAICSCGSSRAGAARRAARGSRISAAR